MNSTVPKFLIRAFILIMANSPTPKPEIWDILITHQEGKLTMAPDLLMNRSRDNLLEGEVHPHSLIVIDSLPYIQDPANFCTQCSRKPSVIIEIGIS